MPELPEVETIVRDMHEAHLLGLTILKATVFWDRSIGDMTSQAFCQKIKGKKIRDISRRGKFLVFHLGNEKLLVHLRMTGKFLIDKKKDSFHKHERVRLYLSDGQILHFEDQRKFGKWYLGASEEKLKKIGLEPLSSDFSLDAFKKLLKGKRSIKAFLLDQKYVAGIGNIYADEALWLAKIHPARHVESLEPKEIQALHHAIIFVLTAGVENTGTTLGSNRANYFSVSGRRGSNQNNLKVFRFDGSPCPRCQTIIKKITVAQRGTHYCPNCQKL